MNHENMTKKELNAALTKPVQSALYHMRQARIDLVAKAFACDAAFTAAFINALAERVHMDNVSAGWWTNLSTGESTLRTRNVPEMLMLIVSEVAEAMEGHRKNLMDDKLPHRPMLQTELADAIIRILDLAGSREAIAKEDYINREGAWKGLCKEDVTHPIGTIIQEKRAFNRNRADHKPENRLKDGGKAF